MTGLSDASGPLPVVVDSSGWIEYFTDGANAEAFAPAIDAVESLLVPSICLLEVFRWILRNHGEGPALRATALMQRGVLVDLTAELALGAALLGLQHGLPLADSVILATARAHGARLLTQDRDFEGLVDVELVPKRSL